MFEAMVVLILLTFIFLILYGKKKSGDQATVHKFINKLKGAEKSKTKERGEMIAEYCNLEPSELNDITNEICSKERELYKKIIQIFLSKDKKILMKMDQYIEGLAEPYIRIAGVSASTNEVEGESLEIAKTEINRLKQETEALRKEIKINTDSMEEITAEYTRVFSGSQTALALENSSKKMFGILRDIENRVRESVKINETEGL